MTGNLTFILAPENVQNAETTFIGQNLNTIQMVTASNVGANGPDYGFLLSGSDTTGSQGTFLLPFSQDDPTQGFSGIKDNNRLSIGGPQLAVFHSYNQQVASSSIKNLSFGCSIVSSSDVWVNQGIDPSLPENYYQWSPSSSDCPFYEDNQQPYVIERGDILRVEGLKSVHSPTIPKLTGSIAFTENFTVEEVQNYYYSSSDFAPNALTIIPESVPLSVNVSTASPNQFPGYILRPNGGVDLAAQYTTQASTSPTPNTEFTVTRDGVAVGADLSLLITPFSKGVAGNWVLNFNSFSVEVNGSSPISIGTAFNAGDLITIPAATINNIFGLSLTPQFEDILIVIDASMINGGISNQFTTAVQLNSECGIIPNESLLAEAAGTNSNYDQNSLFTVAPNGGINSGTGAIFALGFTGGLGASSLTTLVALTGGSGYIGGDTFTWSAGILNTAIGGGSSGTGDLTLTLTADNTYDQGDYKTWPQGQIGLTLPTFLKTDRNPSEVLNGLKGGGINKFTLLKQVENEQKIMIKNTQPPQNTEGYLSPTGGGFIIPNDLSEIQKSNALNIINQLRQQNAFPGDCVKDT